MSGLVRRFGIWSFFPEVVHDLGIFVRVYLSSIILGFIGLATPLFFQAVIDKAVTHNAYSTLTVLGVGILIAICLDALFSVAHDYMLLHVNPKTDIRITSRVFTKLLSLPVSFFEENRAGSLTRDIQQAHVIRDFMTGRLFFGFTELTALIIFLPVLFCYSIGLTMVVLGFSGALSTLSAVLAIPFRKRSTALYDAENERQALLVETLHGMATVKAIGLESVQQKRWEQRCVQALRRSRELYWLATKARTASSVLDRIMTIAVIWLGAFMVFDGNISVGELVAFQMLAGRVTGPLMYLTSLIQAYQETSVSARNMANVMDAQSEPRFTSALNPQIKGEVCFENVTFQYDQQTEPALADISLSIPVGTVLGVVGRSGSGKSTLTRLVQGLLTPESGTVRIDGYDLRELDHAHLRRSIGVVPQEGFLFRGSVRDNIAAFDPEVNFDEIVWAAEQAGADNFIRHLPKGYETLLQEGAVNLSGGQKQRITIARALLHHPQILIFDEATSSLDLETEAAIQENIREIIQGRTAIIVSHRLSSLRNTDCLLVLDRGRIVGFGSHHEVLGSCLIYRQLWNCQPVREVA